MGRAHIQKHCLTAVLACFEVHHVRPGTAATAEAMTVPQRRLAGLWPWLLMAALQVVLGQPGLESERPALRAVIKVALLNHELTGKSITLEGVFVGGSAGHAEGKLMQVRCYKGVYCMSTTCLSKSKHISVVKMKGWAPVVRVVQVFHCTKT